MDLLEYAKRMGLDLAVKTNMMEELSKVILKELGLLEYFSSFINLMLQAKVLGGW